MTYIIFFSGLIYSDSLNSEVYDTEYMEVDQNFFDRLIKAQAGAGSSETGIFLKSFKLMRIVMPVIQKDFGSDVDRFNQIDSLNEQLPF
mgnify:CR=1 FL=1|tara:strand:- start:452 stop:718 length:267 start_codon:yes stop_codon:yes gene_type:complete